MIHTVARCPYCLKVAAGLDADRPALVISPDQADGRPCEHLAFVYVGLDVGPVGVRARVSERSGQWLWVRGEGLRLPGNLAGSLAEWVGVIACELIKPNERPSTPYQIGGGTAFEREEVRSGNDSLRLTGTDGRRLDGVLDGWGLFSESPDALVEEVRKMAGEENTINPMR